MVDPASVDWSTARRAAYRLRQTFRYEYAAPIADLNHRLVVIPPMRFGDQRRTYHELLVELEEVRLQNREDRFGNVVFEVFAPEVPKAIEFVAEVSVERSASEPHILAGGWPADDYLLEATPLTAADERIQAAADKLGAGADWGLQLADQINDWVYRSMTYRYGVTGVRTTAAEALAVGAGVCQDYAHVMLAVCRACALPSRYVSGHMLGQGGTHAWVEVVLPDDGGRDAVAWAFDPTHAGRAGLGYVTIAVGRDYADVAPTSGSYRSGGAGRLTTSKQVTLTDLG
ncbi:MAG: transglutaminase family protein [Chloroflexi bacterium]|nr:MAG: transglutaminase family protein [Chloroflexota bacterium]